MIKILCKHMKLKKKCIIYKKEILKKNKKRREISRLFKLLDDFLFYSYRFR